MEDVISIEELKAADIGYTRTSTYREFIRALPEHGSARRWDEAKVTATSPSAWRTGLYLAAKLEGVDIFTRSIANADGNPVIYVGRKEAEPSYHLVEAIRAYKEHTNLY